MAGISSHRRFDATTRIFEEDMYMPKSAFIGALAGAILLAGVAGPVAHLAAQSPDGLPKRGLPVAAEP